MTVWGVTHILGCDAFRSESRHRTRVLALINSLQFYFVGCFSDECSGLRRDVVWLIKIGFNASMDELRSKSKNDANDYNLKTEVVRPFSKGMNVVCAKVSS